MAVGIPLDVLMLWFSDGTYSSSKATLTQAHEAILKRQQMLIRCLIAPLVMWRIHKAIREGDLPPAPTDEYGLPAITIDWRLPAYEWMDANDSLQSSLLSIRAGLSTLREECEKRGHNLEDLMRAKIDDLKLINRLASEAGVSTSELSDVVVLGAPKMEV
jgi:capsid protein